MASIKLLEKTITASEKIQKNDVDQQLFDEIVRQIENEEADKAQKKIENVLNEKILDIRLIAFFLYADFLDSGLTSLTKTLPLLQNLIEEKWESLQPEKRREKHTETSIYWYFTHIINKIKYCEKLLQRGTKHPILKKCEQETTQEQYDELLTEVKNFIAYFLEKWPKSQTIERISHLLKKIEDFKKLYSAPPEEPEEEEIVEEVIEEKTAEPVKPKIADSNEWMRLCNQLKTFEELIENEAYEKAAICAQTITHEIENFDPTHYFPQLFSTFFALHAKHAKVIARHWEQKESLQWKLLENLFKADIETFVDW